MHLVMQYCDMGTLDQAIKSGAFWDEETGEPLLVRVWVGCCCMDAAGVRGRGWRVGG